jgi:hypothetical protein
MCRLAGILVNTESETVSARGCTIAHLFPGADCLYGALIRWNAGLKRRSLKQASSPRMRGRESNGRRIIFIRTECEGWPALFRVSAIDPIGCYPIGVICRKRRLWRTPTPVFLYFDPFLDDSQWLMGSGRRKTANRSTAFGRTSSKAFTGRRPLAGITGKMQFGFTSNAISIYGSEIVLK